MFVFLCLTLFLGAADSALADDPVYREQNEYPVLDAMTAERDSLLAFRDSVRAEIDALYAEQKKAKKEAGRDLRVDWTNIETPTDPGQFEQLWHMPPVPQYYTGTCWAFCSVSYLESEAKRLTTSRSSCRRCGSSTGSTWRRPAASCGSSATRRWTQGGQDHGTLEIVQPVRRRSPRGLPRGPGQPGPP